MGGIFSCTKKEKSELEKLEQKRLRDLGTIGMKGVLKKEGFTEKTPFDEDFIDDHLRPYFKSLAGTIQEKGLGDDYKDKLKKAKIQYTEVEDENDTDKVYIVPTVLNPKDFTRVETVILSILRTTAEKEIDTKPSDSQSSAPGF